LSTPINPSRWKLAYYLAVVGILSVFWTMITAVSTPVQWANQLIYNEATMPRKRSKPITLHKINPAREVLQSKLRKGAYRIGQKQIKELYATLDNEGAIKKLEDEIREELLSRASLIGVTGVAPHDLRIGPIELTGILKTASGLLINERCTRIWLPKP
jgi:hypothetical protein